MLTYFGRYVLWLWLLVSSHYNLVIIFQTTISIALCFTVYCCVIHLRSGWLIVVFCTSRFRIQSLPNKIQLFVHTEGGGDSQAVADGLKADSFVKANLLHELWLLQCCKFSAEAPKCPELSLSYCEETVNEINCQVIGRAKQRLKLHELIRISKMMYGWLDIGSQKKKIGQIGMFSYCGS